MPVSTLSETRQPGTTTSTDLLAAIARDRVEVDVLRLSLQRAGQRYQDATLIEGEGNYLALSVCGGVTEIVRRTDGASAARVVRAWAMSGCSNPSCRSAHFVCEAPTGWDVTKLDTKREEPSPATKAARTERRRERQRLWARTMKARATESASAALCEASSACV